MESRPDYDDTGDAPLNLWDITFWYALHLFTLIMLNRRLVRGFNSDGKLVRLYWDNGSNWEEVYKRRWGKPWPKPIWQRE